MMINIEAEGKKIHIFSRDKDGKYIHEIKDFNPYFYVCEDEEEKIRELKLEKGEGAISIDGKKVVKVICNHPGEVPYIREKFRRTYEADVLYHHRYAIDMISKEDMEKIGPLSICYLDIETLIGEEEVDAEKANLPITCIGCYSSSLNKYIQFAWHEKKNEYKEKTKEYSLYVFSNEKRMLEKFSLFLQSLNPDIITAWFGEKFDFPYLLNRMNFLGLDVNRLSPLNEVSLGREVKIRGRTLLDMYWAYRKLIPGEKESFSLDYIGKLEVGIGKKKYEGTLDELWKNDFISFLEYNKKDVEIIVMLDRKLGIIDLFNEMRKISKTTFDDIFSSTKIIDNLILDFCKNKFVLPTKEKGVKRERIKGAIVLEPVVGLHEKVCLADLRSLYPSCMLTFNMSYETVGKGDIKLENGISFAREPRGIFPQIIEMLFKKRFYWKKKMKEYEEGSEEYRRCYLRQYAYKILLNSFYGATIFPGFRLYKKEIGESVTFVGRKILTLSKEVLEREGFKPLYGDTDSLFFKAKDEDEAKEVIRKINESYDDFVKRYGINKHYFCLEYEKFYDCIFFGRSKKRYAGKYYNGKKYEYDIVGFESRRSDTPEVGRNIQRKLFSLILERASKDEIKNFINKSIKEVERLCDEEPEKVGLPITITKNLYSYNKNMPIHVRAAIFSNKYLNENIKGGDKIKYAYVINPRTDVVAFKTKFPKGFKVDKKQMVERIVFMKIRNILEALGWEDIELELKGTQSLKRWMNC